MSTRTDQKQTPQNGYAIRAIREREGVTISELAQTVGISDAHLRNIELEHRSARPEITARIARSLRIPIAAIARKPSIAVGHKVA